MGSSPIISSMETRQAVKVWRVFSVLFRRIYAVSSYYIDDIETGLPSVRGDSAGNAYRNGPPWPFAIPPARQEDPFLFADPRGDAAMGHGVFSYYIGKKEKKLYQILLASI